MLIVLCGPPDSGKRTIAKCLVNDTDDGFLPPFTLLTVRAFADHDAKSSPPVASASAPHAIIECGTDRVFGSCKELECYIMSKHRWRLNFVVIMDASNAGIFIAAAIRTLRRRPFVLFVAVDAPLAACFSRSRLPPSSLYDYLLERDRIMYSRYSTGGATASCLEQTMRSADLTILNDTDIELDGCVSAEMCTGTGTSTSLSMQKLRRALQNLDLPARLRPRWDEYFMQLCAVVAARSNCMKRRVGCVLATSSRRILTAGYNGTPSGLPNCADGGCQRCNDNTHAGISLESCLCLHAEENALLDAGRLAAGATLYCTTFPCLGCAKRIVQSSISNVVYENLYCSKEHATVCSLFEIAGVSLRHFASVPSYLVLDQKANNSTVFLPETGEKTPP